jgi:hypothetical protein
MKETTSAAEKDNAFAAEDLALTIRALLDQQQLSKARQTAARAIRLHVEESFALFNHQMKTPLRGPRLRSICSI